MGAQLAKLGRIHFKAIMTVCAACLASLVLTGCIAMQAASAVTSSAISSVNAVGRAVTVGSNTIARSVQRIPASMMYNSVPRRVVIPVRSAPTQSTTAQRAAATRARTQYARAARDAAKKASTRKISKERAEILEVLPPELLDQLNKDQLILQAMVQQDALEGPEDEIVFWELEDGSAGTASAAATHQMGNFTCRAMVETVKLNDGTDEATESRATACRTEATGWTLSF